MYCDFSDVILEIDILMKELKWDVEQGRSFLLQHYGKRSRHFLSDRELLDFADKLRKLAVFLKHLQLAFVFQEASQQGPTFSLQEQEEQTPCIC